MMVSPPNGSDYEIDIGKYLIRKNSELSVGDEFEFETVIPIPMRSLVSLDGQFYGTVARCIGAVGGLVTYRAISRLAQLQYRYSFPTAYGSGAPDSSDTHLPLSAVLASDPPSQAAGSDQYVVGRIWGLNSLIWPDAGEWSSAGIWTCEDAGILSRIGDAAIYYCGVLCSEVNTPGDLTGGSFRVYRGADVLMVRGAGSGDIYGPIHADNAFDTGTRLGNIETDDNIFVGIQIGLGTEWDYIAAIVRDMGMFISIRDTEDATYIDISDSPPGRGSFGSPYADLVEGDIVEWERLSYSGVPPNTVMGLGRGEQYSRVGSIRGATVYELVDTSNSFKSPWGSISALVDERYEMIRAEAKLKITTSKTYLKEGDWIRAELSPSDHPIGQILRADDAGNGLLKITVGGVDGTYEDIALSPGVEADYVRRLFGYSETEDTINMRDIRDIYINTYTSGVNYYPRMCGDGAGYFYISDPRGGTLSKIDPVNKIVVKSVETEHVSRTGIACDGTYLYTLSAIFDLNLNLISTHAVWGGTSHTHIDVNSNYIYVAEYSAGVIKRYNKSTLAYIDSFPATNYAYICTCDDNYLYCLYGPNIYRYAADDPSSHISVAAANYGQPYGMVYDGSKLYIASIHPLNGTPYFVRFSGALVLEQQKTTGYAARHCGCSDKDDATYFWVLVSPNGVSYSSIYKIVKADLSYNDGFGETTMPSAFEMEFTTKDFDGGAAKVLFTLECQESGAYSWGSIQGTFRVYVNDSLAAVLRNCTVTGTPIDSLDITAWLNLDGSNETIEVFGEWDNPLEEISFLGYVEGTQGYIP